jgi:ADP-ribose pyrophosphatase
MPSWKKLKSRLVYSNKYFSVHEDDAITPEGVKVKYYNIQSGEGAVVIPFDGRNIYLINQYRYVIKQSSWEFPAGSIEKKETALQSAKRELKEEAGITAKKWTYLGKFAPSNSTLNRIGRVFLAENLTLGKNKLEIGEGDIKLKKFSLKQIDQMVRKNIITDAWALVPLYLFEKHLNKKKL